MSIFKLELSDLRKNCEEEINLYFRGQEIDTGYCYELFRRCLQDRDQNAWEHAYTLFEPQVARWVRSHRLFFDSGEEASYFVNRAMDKFWSAISPKKFSKFDDIKHLLGYLKMCVGSAIVDFYRKQERSQLGLEKLQEQVEADVTSEDLYTEESELWKMVERMMKNKSEQAVLHASFVLGMKPKEINAQYPGVFDSIKEIYQIKENILSRLRRNDELRKFL